MNRNRESDELIDVNRELVFQNEERGKRAAELIIANEELAYQNEEKGKRAAELAIANLELIFQNEEKGKRAAELIIANEELIFQNEEKGKRAAELVIANEELVFQNEEKGKRAAELIIANAELVYQNEEKGKRAAELVVANKELLAFTYISSHDLQEPLRKIQTFAGFILKKEEPNLSPIGKEYFQRMQSAAARMQQLIDDLLEYSRINATERKFVQTDIRRIIEEVKTDLEDTIEEKGAVIELRSMCNVRVIPFQFRQLITNLLGNAFKFSKPSGIPHITINSANIIAGVDDPANLVPGKAYCHISVKDNGIGFEPEFNERIFDVFQKLHSRDDYPGTGIGLAIVKKIVDNHNGIISASGELNKGATFNIYIPAAD